MCRKRRRQLFQTEMPGKILLTDAKMNELFAKFQHLLRFLKLGMLKTWLHLFDHQPQQRP